MAIPAYTDQTTLERRFTAERVAQIFAIQQLDGSNTGTADAPTLNACIADASAEFDEIMGTVFELPFAQYLQGEIPALAWDPAIIEIVSIFTMWRGTSLRQEYKTGTDKTVSAPFASEYKGALKRCEEIKQGKRRLIGASPLAANTGGKVTNFNPAPDASPRYFEPDPNTGTGGMQGFAILFFILGNLVRWHLGL